MVLEELFKYLKKEDVIEEEIDATPVDFGVEEEVLIQILKDTVDTSWGRGTLDRERIYAWLDNFIGLVFDKEYERKLALILAVHIVYYNEDDIRYLVKIAYRKLLHQIMTKERVSLEKAAESVVFYPLGSVSESGPFLSYYFRKENNLPVEFFANSIENVANSSNVRNIVLLDDVSISGSQVSWYLNQMKHREEIWNKIFQEKTLYALFLISTIKAQKELKNQKVHLCTPILMDERSECFREESAIYKMFDKGVRDKLRMQSKFMAEKYGYKLLLKQYSYNGEFQRLLDLGKPAETIKKKLKKDALGYDDSEILTVFEYNTPNNSLPIIWVETDKWVPLFKRHDKLYTTQVVGGIKNDNKYI
ncbi:MAG: hypothetical protein NC293_00430 [Roseburia sp.]|nr:hypothetical protein [Roseburia sp.]